MKTKLLLFIILAFCATSKAQIIPNPGFENWTVTNGVLQPTGWYVFSTTIPNVLRAPGYSGNYSAEFIVDTSGGHINGGQIQFDYTGSIRPVSFSGFWKGSVLGNGYMVPTVEVFDNTGNDVAWGDTYFIGTDNNWTQFTVVPTYYNNNIAKTTQFSFWLATDLASDYVYIDSLSLSYLTSTNDLIHATFPSAVMLPGANNTDEILYMDILGSEPASINVYDISGKNIYSKNIQLNDHTEEVIPASLFVSGMYMCTINSKSFDKTIKFIK